MIDLLNYRFTRDKKDDESMEDVYDGVLYKNLSKPGGFLSNPSNISFLGNTDGVALIKSTGWSVWPVYLVVNELPPLLRYLEQTKSLENVPTCMSNNIASEYTLHTCSLYQKHLSAKLIFA